VATLASSAAALASRARRWRSRDFLALVCAGAGTPLSVARDTRVSILRRHGCQRPADDFLRPASHACFSSVRVHCSGCRRLCALTSPALDTRRRASFPYSATTMRPAASTVMPQGLLKRALAPLPSSKPASSSPLKARSGVRSPQTGLSLLIVYFLRSPSRVLYRTEPTTDPPNGTVCFFRRSSGRVNAVIPHTTRKNDS